VRRWQNFYHAGQKRRGKSKRTAFHGRLRIPYVKNAEPSPLSGGAEISLTVEPKHIGEFMTDSPELNQDGALRMIRQDLASFPVEPAMQQNVKDHYEHLQHLAGSLRKLGVDSKVIDQSVIEIFNAYKVQLMRNLHDADLAAHSPSGETA
jgi:hypothetical protein